MVNDTDRIWCDNKHGIGSSFFNASGKRIMKDILLGILATVAVIAGTLLFIYGASAMPYEEVGLWRELSLTLGLGILGGLYIWWKTN